MLALHKSSNLPGLVAAGALFLALSMGRAAVPDPGISQGWDASGVVHNGAWQNGVPLGAIGCGRFELLPSGWFSRFSINHNWDEPNWEDPWRPSRATFFAVRAGETTRWLRFGWREQELPGVSQIAHVAYRGQFPSLDASFDDPTLAVRIALHAWSALVPHNVKDSSLPVAFFEFTLENPTAQPLDVSLLFSLEHFIGCGGYRVPGKHDRWRETDGNRVEPAAVKDTPLTGLRMFSSKTFDGMRQNSAGEYWLLSDGPTTTRGWDAGSDGRELVEAFGKHGELSGAAGPATAGSVCRKVSVPANGKQKVLFTFIWWMPHHVTMDGKDHGHFYLREFQNPASLAAYAFAQRERLERETTAWAKLVNDSNLPDWLKQLVINSTHPMFGNTVLTRDGEFSVQEDPSWMEGALGTLDQRTVSHVFAETFFPELSRAELSLFGKCQQPSGELTHFVGNVYQTIGDPRVHYGITGWPDLAAVYVWQVLKHYRWTGDRALLDAAWPGIKRALDWLATTDRDGDGIPEGGTTFDAGVQYAGGFVFTASAYAAALQSAVEIATLENDDATRAACQQRLERVRATMRQRLWTGQYFAKCYLPDRGGAAIPTLFTPQLAGDWLTRALGLPRIVSENEARSSLEALFNVNGRRSPWTIADEFTPDGNAHNDHSWFTYQWTYFDGLATAEGFVDDALEAAWRVYDALYHYNRTPWGVPINFNPSLKDCPPNGASYMSAMAAWWWLYQLAGASVDVPGGTLWLSPRLPTNMTELHLPLFFPRTWFWLDCAPAKKIFQVKVLRHFGEPAVFKRISGDATEAVSLAEPFVAKEGAVLDLEPWRSKLVTTTTRVPILQHRAFQFRRDGLPTLAWSASCSEPNSSFAPDQAFDGCLNTRWQSGAPATPQTWWQVDFGRREQFKSVEAVTAPAGVTIELSDDGKQWQAMAPNTNQHHARFVRLRPSAPSAEPWRVYEVTVHP